MTFTGGKSVQFQCDYSGFPTPQIQWFKDDQPIDVETDRRFTFPNASLSLFNISVASTNDAGRYKCVVKNFKGQESCEIELKGNLNCRYVDIAF